MTHSTRRKRWLLLTAITLSVSTLASCAEKKIDFELTGTAYDKQSKKPIEGAYAVAIYMNLRAGYAAVRSHCVKTKGMYTGKDGKYHFPVEKRDGYSPLGVDVIHADYVSGVDIPKPPDIHRQQRAEAYTDRNVYMEKQDPAKPVFGGDDVWCTQATKREDVVAAIEFYKIKRSQYVKFNRGQPSLDNIDSMIGDLEKIGKQPPTLVID